VIACLLKNEPASYFVLQVKRVKPRSRSESESERARVARSRPETGRATHGQGEGPLTRTGGPNPGLLQKAGRSCG
jgi:hypothetical protein